MNERSKIIEISQNLASHKIGQIREIFAFFETGINQIKTVRNIDKIQHINHVLDLLAEELIRKLNTNQEISLASIAKEDFIEEIRAFISACDSDSRQGVQKLLVAFQGKCEKLLIEIKRSQLMYAYERKAWLNGKLNIAGIDEVGRGCLAGPVVAGVVVLPIEPAILYLNDSKKLSAKNREEISETVKKYALNYALGEVDNLTIDRDGIADASFSAMREGISKLDLEVDYLLVDAFRIPQTDIPQENIVGGDLASASIAAASIVAKVYRDHLMQEYDQKFPTYKLASNKGYGSREHQEALARDGLSEIHRKSFNKAYL